ncbi:MobF family relaxase [Cryptosporangium sp. NPDC051539]|uniref:MobF family relaxase n=1 Tax=Cryptosporangium sp. NPDC051539 TaxID=3363962 RepID=UPI0037B19612
MLSVKSGRYSSDYYTSASDEENYYTGAVGEPPGRWSGEGAAHLGLVGDVDAQDMNAVYDHFVDPRDLAFRDPEGWADAEKLGHTGRSYKTAEEIYAGLLDREPDASPERREQLRAEASGKERKNVGFHDATFSVQKSITVLHAAFEREEVQARNAGDNEAANAWQVYRVAVEEAMWAGNQASLDYLAKTAGYTRTGHHGGAANRFADAHDWTVASFFQHDSRDNDPQLHIHNVILNRVQGSDGKWRTLHGALLHQQRGAAAAVGERTTEEHLTRTLGVRFAARPDGKAREVVGVDEAVRDLFSSRRRSITRKTAELVAQFEQRFGREPNALELSRLAQRATLATRASKSHEAKTVEERLERWDQQLRAEVAEGLAGVANSVLQQRGEAQAGTFVAAEVIETALADVQAGQAAWTRADLTRAISDALPDHLGGLTGAEVTALLDGLTDQALSLAVPLDAERPGDQTLPDELRLANGESAYTEPGSRRYATPDHIHTERLLQVSATQGSSPSLSSEQARLFLEELAAAGVELGADQAAAVSGVLTSGSGVETLIGPAGTGKSFVVGMLAKAWTDQELWNGRSRQVVGLAASQIATNVLAGEGLRAMNITRWLNAQQDIAAHAGQRARPETEAWRVRPGDLIVVDESAMADTASLAQITEYVQAGGGKLLLVGDPRQLAAVGAVGGMELTIGFAPSYELTDARRFTHQWEADASLRLRAHDPEVLGEYHRHGRVLDGGTVEQAEASASRAWLADHLAGQHTMLIVDTNEQAARVAAQLRADLVKLGRVQEDGVLLGLQGTFAGVGDIVQARDNNWALGREYGNRRAPINRESYRVIETRDDGGLVVEPLAHPGERMALPGEYVGKSMALDYASTVHAAQGMTVDTTHTVVTGQTGPEAFYVGMSRGRESNTAHVTTRAVPVDSPTGATSDVPRKDPLVVLASTLEDADPQLSALQTAVESADEAGHLRTAVELLADAAEIAVAGRTARWLDELTAEGALTIDQRTRLAAEDGATTLNRLLRRAEVAGHDPREALWDAVTDPRGLEDARQISNTLHYRITQAVDLTPAGTSYTDWTSAVDDAQWAVHLAALAAAADARRVELGEAAISDPPTWAVEAFGPVPPDREAQQAWAERAGAVAAHRELTGHDDEKTPLGRPPKPGQVEEYASWRTAWDALGRPAADRDEVELSDGQLRMRVRAAEREEAWAPRYVAQELAGTRQAADSQRQTAQIRAAQATAIADTQERARLEQEATDARMLANMLDARAEQLAAADEARAQWLAETAWTRAAADRAKAELAARDVDKEPQRETTAAEWLAAHHEANRVEDHHREITDEADLHDVTDTRAADLNAVTTDADVQRDQVDVENVDVREAAAHDPRPVERDTVQVATAEATADALRRAQRHLIEQRQRNAAQIAMQAYADTERAGQLSHWRERDAARYAESSRESEHALGR